MISFYYHPTPNPAKVALFLEEAGLPYKMVPVDTGKGEQHSEEFRHINPNGKVPAIVDSDGPGGAEARLFDSTAILLYLGEKTGRFLGAPEDRPELLSWLMFIGTGVGPYSGQAVHFQLAAPEKIPYAVNRYRWEARRHYNLLDTRLAQREYLLGDTYTIVDMAAWGWVDRLTNVFNTEPGEALGPFPNLQRWFEQVDARPAVARARALVNDHPFKTVSDEETKRALFPSNYAAQEVSNEA
ncbi:glutathione S-transferase family protein [Microbulbifer sp. TYP-18]|uniref:glutathione S-transferase family protein n=1 Tax=Microbulbifer sp. TYP-18 TaxID=3230024 RepID=UPI0034C6395C